MTHHLYLSHPQVRIDPAVPVPKWGLNEIGRARMAALATQPWIRQFRRIVSSDETKAIETGEALADVLGCNVEVLPSFHENDRSATGFLPPPEFEATADLFFKHPEKSIRGWERAADVQARIIGAVTRALADRPDVPTVFVGHGGVGTLLLCHCSRRPIAR
ncbi:MAG: histidine phosphatase family protein, partial [Beijerinckiaceae bacterium]